MTFLAFTSNRSSKTNALKSFQKEKVLFNLEVNDLCVDGPLAKYLDLKGSPLIGDIKHMADKNQNFPMLQCILRYW